MRIAMIQADEARGGAAQAAFGLYLGLQQQSSVTVQRYVLRGYPETGDSVNFSEGGTASSIIELLLDCYPLNRSRYLEQWERFLLANRLLKCLKAFAPDIINIHGFNQWTKPRFIRRIIPQLAKIAPVVWTLHDCWPINGVLDYPDEREEVRPWIDHETNRLRKCGKNLKFVAPSVWLQSKAKAVFGASNYVAHIPYGVDSNEYRPLDKQTARKAMGVGEKGKFILTLADSMSCKRKGFDLLRNAIKLIEQPITLMAVGREMPTIDDVKYKTITIPWISDRRLLRLLYCCADVVAVPSRSDNLPNVVLEAFACGVPCVGFNVGGIPDMIQPMGSGFISDCYNTQQFADNICRIISLKQEEKKILSKQCRMRARIDYSIEKQALSYLEVFRKNMQDYR